MGGSTTYLINLAGELVKRGIPVKVFCFDAENPMSPDFQAASIPVFCLKNNRRMIFEDQFSAVLPQVAQFQPTVVVATLGGLSFEVLRYMPEGVFRAALGQSDDPNVYKAMGRYTPWMDLAPMVSQTMKEKASIMPEFASVPVVYLAGGVPMSPAAELPVRNPAMPLRILYLGRLDRVQKRVHLFPEILRQLRASGMPFQWTITGDGPDRHFLETSLPAGPANQRVVFTGVVDYRDVPAVLKQHDIFLLASDFEGLPLSLLEAMSHGLVPVISALKSGIPEVVDSSNGMLVPVDDIAGYAQAIIHLDQHRDEFAAKSAAARARVIRDFSVTASADRWLAAFPKPQNVSVTWPKHWSVKPPVGTTRSFYFSPPIRPLRRLLARFAPSAYVLSRKT